MEYYNFRIVNHNDLEKRGYVSFYIEGERIREYNGNNLNLAIHPNRAKNAKEKHRLLKRLLLELKKALKEENYPVISDRPLNRKKKVATEKEKNFPVTDLLRVAISRKMDADLSFYYKKNLKSVYNHFIVFLSRKELKSDVRTLTVSRVQEFLNSYSSSGSNYMNRRRELGVLFSTISLEIGFEINLIRHTQTMKRKAKLHKVYEKEQLIEMFEFLEENNSNLYLCCLICYGCFLRPHQEVRNLTAGDIKKDCTEIHLSGDQNKSGRIRIAYVPDYVKKVLLKRTKGLQEWQNIFTGKDTPFNRSYFHTRWQRLKSRMISEKILFPLQTLYSFRHSAAVNVYRKTKDIDIVKKLMGHSDMIVTIKYLRGLGEYSDESLKDYLPDL